MKPDDMLEVVVMLHMENRALLSALEFYQMHIDMDTATGDIAFQMFVDRMKSAIVAKLRQLSYDGRIHDKIKVYVNHKRK